MDNTLFGTGMLELLLILKLLNFNTLFGTGMLELLLILKRQLSKMRTK